MIPLEAKIASLIVWCVSVSRCCASAGCAFFAMGTLANESIGRLMVFVRAHVVHAPSAHALWFHSQNGAHFTDDPPSTLTISPMFPPPSGIAAITKRAAVSAPSASGHKLSPVSIVMISAAVLAICMASLCMWRRLLTRDVVQHVPFRQHQIARGRENFGYHVDTDRKPKMFDSWTERRISSGLKWEEYSSKVSVMPNVYLEWRSSPCTTTFVAYLRNGLNGRKSETRFWACAEGRKTSERRCEGVWEPQPGELQHTSRGPRFDAVTTTLHEE